MSSVVIIVLKKADHVSLSLFRRHAFYDYSAVTPVSNANLLPVSKSRTILSHTRLRPKYRYVLQSIVAQLGVTPVTWVFVEWLHRLSAGNAAPVMQIERDWKFNDATNTARVEDFLVSTSGRVSVAVQGCCTVVPVVPSASIDIVVGYWSRAGGEDRVSCCPSGPRDFFLDQYDLPNFVSVVVVYSLLLLVILIIIIIIIITLTISNAP